MSHIEYKVRVYEDGTKEWRHNNELHRENGPAIEKPRGTKEWHKHGLRHREDGPAVEDANGCKQWWINGIRHRKDGPAITYGNGNREYYIKGKKFTEAEFRAETSSCNPLKSTIVIDGKTYKLVED